MVVLSVGVVGVGALHRSLSNSPEMSLSSDDQELVFKKKKGTKNAANRKRKISDEAGVGGQSQSGGWSQSGQDKDTDTEVRKQLICVAE